MEQLGGLDVLVDNAAYREWQPSLTDISTEQVGQRMKTKVQAMFRMTKAGLPYPPEGATIMNRSSVVAEPGAEFC